MDEFANLHRGLYTSVRCMVPIAKASNEKIVRAGVKELGGSGEAYLGSCSKCISCCY